MAKAPEKKHTKQPVGYGTFFGVLLAIAAAIYLTLLPYFKLKDGNILDNYECKVQYSIRILSRDPLVLLINNFITEEDANHIRNISESRMNRSPVTESADNYHAVSDVRTSSSAFLKVSEDDVVSCLEKKASELVGVPRKDTEPLQVVWYTKGQKYDPHFDYFPRKDLTDYWSVRSGQRIATILVYLNEGMDGGSTLFPKLNIEVRPKTGSALLWFNANTLEVEDHRTLHGGMAVEKGEKWAINIWMRKKIPGWDNKESPPETLNYNVDLPEDSVRVVY